MIASRWSLVADLCLLRQDLHDNCGSFARYTVAAMTRCSLAAAAPRGTPPVESRTKKIRRAARSPFLCPGPGPGFRSHQSAAGPGGPGPRGPRGPRSPAPPKLVAPRSRDRRCARCQRPAPLSTSASIGPAAPHRIRCTCTELTHNKTRPSLKIPAVNARESPQGQDVDHKHLPHKLNCKSPLPHLPHLTSQTLRTGSLHLVCREEKADHVMHRPLKYVHLQTEQLEDAGFAVAAASKLTSPSDTNACSGEKTRRARRPKAPGPSIGRSTDPLADDTLVSSPGQFPRL